EDEVHIGSDTQLIAPIRVGKGATVGAGSTLNKDVPSYQLTLTHRLEPRSSDWQRPQKHKPLEDGK
ncbi:MAG TPA: bifunctional UDP-N-acetylglucosamine diphosphorylase/glucosamine-1-phosphate N-acetyltransferase GlmU, partial [Candidatus Berkiella sp.]|nr:bifunctional UDP-N-acetylglucosamine diphosphorylase/glucosamine-1-phosphate N-acetyltransferase GlmU [Candidatus Berkiella sp.]